MRTLLPPLRPGPSRISVLSVKKLSPNEISVKSAARIKPSGSFCSTRGALLTEKRGCSKRAKANTRFCLRVRIGNVRIRAGYKNIQTGPVVAAQDNKTMEIIETLENRKGAVKISELARLLSVTPKHIYKTRAAERIPGALWVNRALRFDPQNPGRVVEKRAQG